jgi:hypothetical protein
MTRDYLPFLDCTPEYLARRDAARLCVHDALARCGVAIDAVRGSWRYGDFHLSSYGRISMSDLDLVITGMTDSEIASLRPEIERRLAPALQIPVSIHPLESMRGMSSDDARLLAIGEYLISILRKVQAGRMSADYARAKVTLLFLRRTTDERYPEVAFRMDEPGIIRAAKVKLGIAADFTVADMTHCLQNERDETIQRFIAGCLLHNPTSEFVRKWERDVRAASSVSQWLKEFLISRSLECIAG